MKVLVLGGSGFIGLPVAHALSRAGHIVYAQTRSTQKAKELQAKEITPTVAEPTSTDWLYLIATIDIVIDTIGGTADISTLANSMFQAVVSAAQGRAPGTPKLTYIYTSGTWVHGDNRNDIVSDTSPLYPPVDLVKWRPAQEQVVVTNTVVNGIVIRPSLLYGYSGSLFSPLFSEAVNAKKEGREMVFAGTPGGRFATIHVDDLADLYVRVAEKAALVKGMIIDGSNTATESVDDVLSAIVKVAGLPQGFAYRAPENDFEKAIASTQLVIPYLARSILDWHPRKMSLVDGMATYYAAFVASGTAAQLFQ